MRWPPARRVLVATLVAVAVLGVGRGARGRSASHAASPGVIVFASDRAKLTTRARSTRSRPDVRRATSRTAWRANTASRWLPWAIRSRSGATAAASTEVYLARSDGIAPAPRLAASARASRPSTVPRGRHPDRSRPMARCDRRGALQASHQRRFRDRRATSDRRGDPPLRRRASRRRRTASCSPAACSGSTGVYDICGAPALHAPVLAARSGRAAAG